MERPEKLSVRLGCPLAFALTAAVVLLVGAGRAHIMGRSMFDFWPGFLSLGAIAAPFLLLAAARTRDGLAWLIATVLTAALWGWHLYDLTLHRGVNFAFGPIQLLVAPLVICGLSLVTAGVRGRIPDWGVDGE